MVLSRGDGSMSVIKKKEEERMEASLKFFSRL